MLRRLALLIAFCCTSEAFTLTTAAVQTPALTRNMRAPTVAIRCEAASEPEDTMDTNSETPVQPEKQESFVAAPAGAGGVSEGQDVWATSKPIIVFSVMTGLFAIGKFFN